MGLFAAGERRRSRRSRRARTSVRSILAGGERRRSHRRRSARALFKGLMERRRSRRSHRARQSLAGMGLKGHRFPKKARRSKARRSTKKARRSRKGKRHTKWHAVSAHKRRTKERRRSRRSRRARQTARFSGRTYGLAERRRSRRSRRARQPVRSIKSVKVAERRRSRRSRRARQSMKSIVRFAPRRSIAPSFARASERRRHRSRRGRESGFSLNGMVRQINGSFAEYAKKAGVATVGILGGRVLSGFIGKLGAKAGLFNNSTINQYSGVLTSGVAGGLTYWLTGLRFMPSMVKSNRGLITLGAYLHFVEEILNVAQGWGVLPKSGVMAGALYGYPLGSTQTQGQLGYCSYGCSVPADPSQGPGWQPYTGTSPGLNIPAPGGMYAGQATAPAPAGTAGIAGVPHNHTGMGYCSYGCSVPADPAQSPAWQPYTGTSPGLNIPAPGMYAGQATAPAPAGTAGIGAAAFEQAGFAGSNPAVNDLLVGRANNIQSVLAGAGLNVQ